MLKKFILIATTFSSSMSAVGADEGLLHEALVNNCEAINLVVEGLPNDAIDLGLEEDAIETMARSRLRAARIYTDEKHQAGKTDGYITVRMDDGTTHNFRVDLKSDIYLENTSSIQLADGRTDYLYINTNVVGKAFSIGVDFKQWLRKEEGWIIPAITKNYNVTGTHGGSSTYIMSAISGIVDEFIDDYLRVNENACK